VACWLAAKPLGNFSGAKNYRLETLEESFKNVFRKPWGSIYSTEMFSKVVSFEQMEANMEERGVGGFQMTLVITRYPPEQLTRATTLPQYGTGLSLKFICFSAGSLILYKGL
jgi:hypothetical protein